LILIFVSRSTYTKFPLVAWKMKLLLLACLCVAISAQPLPKRPADESNGESNPKDEALLSRIARETVESKALEDMEQNVQKVLGQLETRYKQVLGHLHDVDNMIAKLW